MARGRGLSSSMSICSAHRVLLEVAFRRSVYSREDWDPLDAVDIVREGGLAWSALVCTSAWPPAGRELSGKAEDWLEKLWNGKL